MSLRAGPLSDEKVIALLNARFIPVYAPYTSEETAGVVSSEQEKEIQRIWNESLQKKLPYGMVHVYLLEPGTGQVFDALGVVKASVTNNLLDLLGRAVEKYAVKEGRPAVKPARQVFPSKVPSDALLLHLTAPVLDAIVGDLLVVADDQLAYGPFAGVEVVAEVDYPVRDQRGA